MGLNPILLLFNRGDDCFCPADIAGQMSVSVCVSLWLKKLCALCLPRSSGRWYGGEFHRGLPRRKPKAEAGPIFRLSPYLLTLSVFAALRETGLNCFNPLELLSYLRTSTYYLEAKGSQRKRWPYLPGLVKMINSRPDP